MWLTFETENAIECRRMRIYLKLKNRGPYIKLILHIFYSFYTLYILVIIYNLTTNLIINYLQDILS